MGLVIRRADVQGLLRDVRIERGVISAVDEKIPLRAGDEEVAGGGGALVPGFHDHHIHLRAWAAAKRSVVVGPPGVSDPHAFANALRTAAASSDGWLRAVGYHESVAGQLDRWILDGAVSDRPVRVQHRSGILWALNSAALKLVGADEDLSPGIERGGDGVPTGRLWRMDSWLARRLASTHGGGFTHRGDDAARSLSVLSREAAARGVTGWTDATPGREPAESRALVDAVAGGRILQRLHLMAPIDSDEATGPTTRGPVKVMLDDDRLPGLEQLRGLVMAARMRRRPVAVHCVTRTQLALAVAALDEAGRGSVELDQPHQGDRIEHGADIPAGYLPVLSERRLTVVTQPNFVYERGDEYLADTHPNELADLWRARSLIDAGIPLAAGTDAPFGSPDPWLAVRSSMRRISRSGREVGSAEALDWTTALGLWQGTATCPSAKRTIAVGEVADVVLLDLPLPAALDGDDPVSVRATLIGGELAFKA